MNARITYEMARELVHYDPETGIVTWMPRPRERFASDLSFASFKATCEGRPVGHISNTGYLATRLEQKMCLVHRLAWLWMTGEWPDTIDHINHDQADNRWCNLRNVTVAENAKNGRLAKNNSSGVSGVSYSARDRRWMATIKANGRANHLGCFKTKSDAVRARKDAERRFGFHPNHGAV